MFKTKQLLIALAAILVVITIFWIIASKSGQSNVANAPVGNQTKRPQSTPENPTLPKQSPPPPQLAKPGSISITSPAPSAKLVIGESSAISWSTQAGVAGSIYLVKASDKSVVGWINSETGPHQTSITWDGRDVAISRYSSLRRNVEHGDYIVKIAFDTNKLPTVSSGVFSLIYQSEVALKTYTITIKGFVASPSSLTVNHGDKLTFTNNDSVTHQIILSSHSPFVIVPGDSYTFDTASLTSGSYSFYSETYPSLRLVVTVK